MAVAPGLLRETVSFGGSIDAEVALQEHLHQAELTDGLPVVVPTTERVDAFINACGFDPEREVGAVPPAFGVATVANVAVNAVMAGARPEHMGIICAALEAMLDPVFNVAGLQVTTNPVGPLTLVNGPIRHRLHIDSGGHAYAGGNNPNGPIGRAIRFVLRNIGEAKGEVDRSTLGMPTKITFCLAENEEASPWEPLHVSLGFRPSDDVVTVLAPEAIIDTCRPTFETVDPIIHDFVHMMTAVGTNRLNSSGTLTWVLPPYLAHLFAEEGWTREKLQQTLFDLAKFNYPTERAIDDKRANRLTYDEAGRILISRSPADIFVIVAGRDDPIHATYLPGVMISHAVSRKVWREGDL